MLMSIMCRPEPHLAGGSFENTVAAAGSSARRAAPSLLVTYTDGIVTSAIADRDEVESALFEALNRYQMAASDLTEASIRLERMDEALAFADAEAVSAEERLAGHTVTAYMEAVAVTAGVALKLGRERRRILDESRVFWLFVLRKNVKDYLRNRRDDLEVEVEELAQMARDLEGEAAPQAAGASA